MGESLPTHHEDHIAGKGDNSLQYFNLVHKFILMLQAMKIPAAKAAVDKEWEIGENFGVAHTLLKIPKSECPDIWIRPPRHKWPKSWSSMEDPVVPLERNLYGHPLAGLLWEREFEKNPIEVRLGEGFQL